MEEEFKFIRGKLMPMFYHLLYPRQTVLVVGATKEKSNLSAVAWITPVSAKPPLLVISLNKNSTTLDLICTSMEFVVAIVGEKMKDAVLLCGTTSGKYIDKFSEAKLAQVKAKQVSVPLVLEAAANIECKVLNYSTAGDHVIVTGEVLEVHEKKNGKEPVLFTKGKKKLFGLAVD